MMPLSMAKSGEIVIIKKITGKDEIRQHLAELGLVVEEAVKVVSEVGGQPDYPGERQPDCPRQNHGKPHYGLKDEVSDERKGETMKTLKEVPVNGVAVVKRLHGEGPVRRRIMDMGITKGVEVKVRKVAPLGDPIELNVRGYELTIRKADAEMIEVL